MKASSKVSKAPSCKSSPFPPSSASDEGEASFIRSTGFSCSAISFKAFLDDELACHINNNRFSKHTVQTGTHHFAVQYHGKYRQANKAVEEVSVKSGEKKYIMLYQQIGLLQAKVLAVEITPAAAQKMMSGLQENSKY